MLSEETETLKINLPTRRMFLFIRKLLLELTYISVILVILSLAIWKFIELVF